jgi:cell division protein FtsB
LLRDVHALKTDPDRMEQIARDKLGLARPGEIVYYYSEP